MKQVSRYRGSEIVVEFTDGTRLFADADESILDLSITGGANDEGDDSSGAREDDFYRTFIDRLVAKCNDGFFEAKVQSRVWNQNARPGRMPEHHERNQLLESLSPNQLQVLGRMLTDMTVEGVFNVLVALYEEGVRPFDRGYEGDPFHDFVGRLHDWEWPVDEARC